MARGQQRGGKTGGGTRTATTANNRTDEDSKQSVNASTKGGHRAQRGSKDKIRNSDNDNHKADDSSPVTTVEPTPNTKPHHLKSPPQATSEQLMIAQLIGGDVRADDPHQRRVIQMIMDITGREEDLVATALFDARWDENIAMNILLEDADNLSEWQESGSKKRKNKQKQASDEANKDEWDEENQENNREKSRNRGGPPRMRRGGSQAPTGNGRANNNHRDQSSNERVGEDGGEWSTSNRRGGGGARRGEPSSRRGGGGGGRGGRSSYPNSRPARPDAAVGGGSAGGNTGNSSEGNFSGSIDTWNNPPSATGGTASSAATAERGGAAGPPRRRGPGGKDAFDNAGNWGDDFPAADEWDNEEYTGSLADTKVFTARPAGTGPVSTAAIVAGSAKPPGRPQTAAEAVGSSVAPSRQPEQANPAVIGQTRSFASSVNGPSSVSQPASSSSYQPIDLSTLLQKPTTQSSLSNSNSSQQQQMLFNQQATDSLRAGLGLGQAPSGQSAPNKPAGYGPYGPSSGSAFPPAPNTNSQTPSYAQSANSAFTSIKPGGAPAPSASNGQPRAPQQPNKVGGGPGMAPPSATAPGQPRSRLPPTSKIPSSAVEMPGDSVGHLDVQFGGLDLKFGSTNESSVIGGFEFGTGDDNSSSKYLNDKSSSAKPPGGLYPAGNKDGVKVGMPPASSAKLPESYVGANSAPKPSVNNTAFSNVIKSSQQQQQQQPQPQQTQHSHQQQQQQHQNDSLGSYYGNYGQQNKSYQQQQQQQSYQQQQQYGNYAGNNSYQNNTSSGYGGQNNYSSSSTASTGGYKMPAAGSNNQYQQQQQQDSINKYDALGSAGSGSALGHQTVHGLTTTTNALSGKVSATTAGKMPNVPNLPPGVTNMLPQHYMTSLPPAAFYSLQQPSAAAMYSAYGSAGGLEDLAALQRSAGLHTLVGASNNPTVPQPGGMKGPSTGYYDPTSQYGVAGNRGDNTGNSLGNSNNAASTSASASGNNSSSAGNADKSAFGSVVSSTDSNSSPIPSTGLQQSTQQSQQQQAAAFNLAASSAFAAQQHMPPGYAYFYGGVPGLQAYGATATAQGVYPGAPMTVQTPGAGSTNNQFQQKYSAYGSAYDTLGQQGSKDFASGYTAGNGGGMAAKSATGGNQAPTGGHQYWGTSPLTNTPLW